MAWIVSLFSGFLLPILLIGTIRKVKARLQNRVGPPIFQALFDLVKLFRKKQTVSSTVSWIFKWNGAINLSVMLLLALSVPWLCYKPVSLGADLFFVLYLLALSRFSTVLAAMDAGSAFGAFGASREVTISTLVEPALVLALASIGILTQSSDLDAIFSFSNAALSNTSGIWLLVGTAVILAGLVELSRMPVDDPTTHLELTMVHEAMILECSGPNLAMLECSQLLRMAILFGLSAQCFLHSIPCVWTMTIVSQGIIHVILMFVIASCVATFESVAVKLQWRKVPEFIAYCLTMSLIAGLIAVGGSLVK
ncbi:MAG: NADH-quinone oxidoreductase subunit H [Candidatus Obscuribacterales bacterium]|nr:NADH-quinone oxidoreductase subunit H [Candidatus Obscuribacterales bacterium]